MYTEDGITAQYDQGVLTFSGSGTLTKTIVDNTIRTLSIAEKSITTINIGGGISAIGERAFYRRGQSSDADTTINIGSTVSERRRKSMMYWSLLGILFIVCAVLCAIGFYKFVYFLSVGYGLAIAGGGITILVMYPLVPIYHLNKKP